MATKRNKTRNTLTSSPKIRTSASRTEAGRGKDETRGNKTSKTSSSLRKTKNRAIVPSDVKGDYDRERDLIGQGIRRNIGSKNITKGNANQKNTSLGSGHTTSDREFDYEGKGRPSRNKQSLVSHGYESERSPVTRWGKGNADEGEYESLGYQHLIHDDLDEGRIQKKKNRH